MDTEDTEGICNVLEGVRQKHSSMRKMDSVEHLESARECLWSEHLKRREGSQPGEASWVLKKTSGYE